MAKNSKRKRNDRQKINFAAYEMDNREEKNRIRKLERHVKAFPNDELAARKLDSFLGVGVPHRRKTRSVGLKLTEDMHRILKHKGKRLTGAKVKLLGLLNNPAKRRPRDTFDDYDHVNAVMERRTRVKYKTVMRRAFEKAWEVQRADAVYIT